MSYAVRSILASTARGNGGVPSRASVLLRSSMRTFAARTGQHGTGTSAASTFLARQAMFSVAFGALSSGTAVALCDDGKSGGGDDIMKKIKDMLGGEEIDGFDINALLDKAATQVGSKVAEAVETGVPTQLSYGFVSGYCSGYALKKAGKAVAVVFGLGFMALQTLSYSGYVDVDHNKLKKDFEGMLDLNNDGKVDKEDMEHAQTKVMEVLQFGLPAGGGFAVGFVSGLKTG